MLTIWKSRENKPVFFIKRVILLMYLTILFLWVTPGFQTVEAQSEPGIDLIILVDQSNSMDKGYEDTPPTDPEQRRVYAARYLIDYLAFDNTLVNPQRTNKVVVIGFGSASRTHILVNLTPLDSAENIRVAKEGIRAEELGDTHFVSALKKIREVFPPETDTEITDGGRQRLIVIISDGGPHDPRGLTEQEYFAEIRSIYEQELGIEKYPLYIVGIDDANVYWNTLGPLWNNLASTDPVADPHAFRVDTVDEVNSQLVSFLCPFLGKTGTSRDCRLQEIGYHFIEPYAYRATFSFFKYRDDSEIELIRPEETTPVRTSPRDPDIIDYQIPSIRDEVYVIADPKPGCWLSQRRGAGRVDVFTDVAFKSFLNLTAPQVAHPQLLPLQIVLEVTDETGGLVPETPDYPVLFDASLTSPNGVTQLIDIQSQSGVDGTYYSINKLEIPVTGTYLVNVSGSVNIPLIPECTEGGTHTLFSQEFSFEVVENDARLATPMHPHLQYEPLDEIVIETIGADGNTVLIPTNPNWKVDLSLLYPSGDPFSLPSHEITNGVLRIPGPVVLSQIGTYELSTKIIDDSGNVFVQRKLYFDAVQNVGIDMLSAYPTRTPFTTTVTVRLSDLSGQLFGPDPAYLLRVEAEILRPDGLQLFGPINLQTVTNSPGTYEGVIGWEMPEAAEYQVHVIGYFDDLGGVEAFSTGFSLVGTDELPTCAFIFPSSTENTFPLHGARWKWPRFWDLFKRTPVEVEVELRQGFNAANAHEIFRSDDPQPLFTATILDVDGAIILEGVPLLEKPDSNGTRFKVALPELTEAGDYRVLVHLAGTLQDGTDYEDFIPPHRATFHLIETPLYKTARVALIVLVSLTTATILFFIGSFVWNRLPPFPKGKLVAKESGVGGEVLDSFILGKRKKVVFSGPRSRSKLQIERIEVRRITRSGGGRKQQEGIEVRAYNKKKELVAQGKMFEQSNGGPPAPCKQLSTDGKRYSFWHGK